MIEPVLTKYLCTNFHVNSCNMFNMVKSEINCFYTGNLQHSLTEWLAWLSFFRKIIFSNSLLLLFLLLIEASFLTSCLKSAFLLCCLILWALSHFLKTTGRKRLTTNYFKTDSLGYVSVFKQNAAQLWLCLWTETLWKIKNVRYPIPRNSCPRLHPLLH